MPCPAARSPRAARPSRPPRAPSRYAAAPAEASAAAGGGLAEQEILTLRAQLVH